MRHIGQKCISKYCIDGILGDRGCIFGDWSCTGSSCWTRRGLRMVGSSWIGGGVDPFGFGTLNSIFSKSCGVLDTIFSIGSRSFSIRSLAFYISMSVWILLLDAFLTLLRLLPISIPLTFLDFFFYSGRANGGSIGQRLLLLLVLVHLVTCRSFGSFSTSMIVGMGILLRVTR